MDQEQKKQERWEIAPTQGCTYTEFLELEEISRLSEYPDYLKNTREIISKKSFEINTKNII